MQIIQRGNPSIMKDIQKQSKHVSESNGIANTSVMDSTPVEFNSSFMGSTGAYATIQKMNAGANQGGAFNSMRKTVSEQPVQRQRTVIRESVDGDKRLYDRLCESVETLKYNKEFSNAVSSLYTLYSMDKLSEGVLSSMTQGDLREVKAIVKEFLGVLEQY